MTVYPRRGYTLGMINRVVVSAALDKAIAKRKIPVHILERLFVWVDLVRTQSLEETRKRHAFHDEPLKGDRAGQRSIRLGPHWRAIYVLRSDGVVEFVELQEVIPHAY